MKSREDGKESRSKGEELERTEVLPEAGRETRASFRISLSQDKEAVTASLSEILLSLAKFVM